MNRAKPPTLYPILEVAPADHEISRAGGSTSTLERLPSRLQQSKHQRSLSLREEMEELVYENSYLKAELAWNTESRQVLLQLQEQTVQAISKIREALMETDYRLRECERRYLELWGIAPGDRSQPGAI